MIPVVAKFRWVGERKIPAKCYLSLIAIVLLLTTMLTGGCSSFSGAGETPSASGPAGATVTGGLAPYNEELMVSLYERAIPAVVKVVAIIQAQKEKIGPFDFDVPEERGQGSGFIIDREGHILTNNHVVSGVTRVRVTLHDDNTIDGEVLGTDKENDLALIKVDVSKLGAITPLSLGDSDKVKPGQIAIALGSPFGLDGSITVGIISGTGRSLPGTTGRTITSVLQTDAAINPGNSGGPLLNSKGEVIGINTAVEASASRIGFAVPISTVKSLLPALIKGGEVKNPWLGISGTAITPELAKKLGLSVESGVYVVTVVPGSPAEKFGLKEGGINVQEEPAFGGDVITAVGGKKVTSVEDLISYFNTKKPGDVVTFSIIRGSQNLTVEVTLGEWPEKISTPQLPSPR